MYFLHTYTHAHVADWEAPPAKHRCHRCARGPAIQSEGLRVHELAYDVVTFQGARACIIVSNRKRGGGEAHC